MVSIVSPNNLGQNKIGLLSLARDETAQTEALSDIGVISGVGQ